MYTNLLTDSIRGVLTDKKKATGVVWLYMCNTYKGYIINTLVPHGTENPGNTDRVHLLSRVDDSFMQPLLSINCNIADK